MKLLRFVHDPWNFFHLHKSSIELVTLDLAFFCHNHDSYDMDVSLLVDSATYWTDHSVMINQEKWACRTKIGIRKGFGLFPCSVM